jgi:HK97 family phage portal protein
MLLETLLGLGHRDRLATIYGSRRISEATGLWPAPSISAGVEVTEATALSLSGVFAAVRLLSQLKASLPLSVYRRQSDGGKRVAVTHPGHTVLHTYPNRDMTSKQARQCLEWNRLLGGNAYGEIQWDGGGNVRAYWPLEHWRVQIQRDDAGKLYYLVDSTRKVAAADMLHVPLVSSDGVCGQSFLDYAGEVLGIGIATQTYAGEFFGSGAYPGGVLQHPGQPTADARQESRESWERMHNRKAGGGGHRVGVLWGGITYNEKAGAISPEDSQCVEQRVFTVQEVARFLGIPPPLLAELSRATFANIEEQNLFFLTYCFTPILVDYEQEYDRKLLSPPELFSKHNIGALLRGKAQERAEFFGKMFGIGALSLNRILELEDENPIGPMGDLRFVPVNMQTLEQAARVAQAAKEPAPEPEPATSPADPPGPAPAEDPQEPDDQEMELRRACEQLLADTLGRLTKKEANEARRAAKQPKKFLAWIDGFYNADYRSTIRAAVTPVLRTAVIAARRDADADELAHVFAIEHLSRSTQELLDLAGAATEAELAPKLETLLTAWTERIATDAAGLMEVCHAKAQQAHTRAA